jgi:hypothetical protein
MQVTGKQLGEFFHPLISPKCRTCCYMKNGLEVIFALYEIGRVTLEEKLCQSMDG